MGKRRNSIVEAAARILRIDGTRSRVTVIDEDEDRVQAGHQIEFSDEIAKIIQQDQASLNSAEKRGESSVGKLLFGKEIGHMDFFEDEMTSNNTSCISYDIEASSSDAKSDNILSKQNAYDVVWIRQRAKSCQISSMKQIISQCVNQYYKVLEHAMIIPCRGYKIEGKNRSGTCGEDYDVSGECIDYSTFGVEHMDQEAHWFRTYFIGKKYATFCGHFESGDPVLLTAICDMESDAQDGQRTFRVIVRTKQGPSIRKTIPYSFLLSAPPDHLDNYTDNESIPDTTWKGVVEMSFNVPFNLLHKIEPDVMVSNGIESEILKLDENVVHKRYKFGVLYVKEGQDKEEEWFSNQHDSENFDWFLNIIGKPVKLQGYTGWAAGLDTRSGDSGEYTYTSVWNDNIVAYHISTLIPSRPGDKQQIQRKRHIGNDIVCVVFVEGQQPFNPAAIKSQFLHVFIVVHEEEWKGRNGWRVEVVMVEDVPEFGPPLPENAIFFDKNELGSFILAKLINAEYAALKSPKFSQPMARAREGILNNIVDRTMDVVQELKPSSKHSKTSSTSSSRSSRSWKSKDISDLVTVPSRSSIMIKDISEGLAGLGRRRSAQDISDARARQTQSKARKARANKNTDSSSKQGCTELDLAQNIPHTASTLTSSQSSGAVLQSFPNKKEGRQY
ncbi:Rap/ran-GAP protein [Apophysomyces sp. BC1034]|nr:Rap/ran-GAP protein [Apophysomyces sp. BC1021]KAG0184961.1 Rap/ran-GAP protein [Apophysomyces sp. BC1034]